MTSVATPPSFKKTNYAMTGSLTFHTCCEVHFPSPYPSWLCIRLPFWVAYIPLSFSIHFVLQIKPFSSLLTTTLPWCNIPLWRTETTYSLRTLARKWSGPFLMLDLIYLIMMWLTDDWCVTIHVYGCYWLSWLSVQVCDLEDAEASVDPLGLRTESGSVLLGWFVIMMLIWCDVLMMVFWHDYWWCRLTIACRLDSHME